MIVLSLITAHLIADFYMQTDEMAKNKEQTLIKHLFHHFLCLLIVTMIFWLREINVSEVLRQVIFPILFILFFHYVIDRLKIELSKSTNTRKRLGEYVEAKLFCLDQVAHIAILILSSSLFFDIPISYIFDKGIRLISTTTSLGTGSTILFLFIIIMLATTVSGHFINKVIGNLPKHISTFEGKFSFKTDESNIHRNQTIPRAQKMLEEYNYTIYNENNYNRGKVIGYIERLIVLILTYYSAYSAIGFIIAAKSIARFKLREERSWAEYFLLGTILSMLIGILLGITTRIILK
jgi:hypothetical protein